MVDNRQNVVLNENDEMFRFMPNQIYIVNEPICRFSNSVNRPSNLIEFKTLPCLNVPELIERRTAENLSFFQMMWNRNNNESAATSASHRFFQNEPKILTDHKIINNNNRNSAVFEIADSDKNSDEDDVVFVKEYRGGSIDVNGRFRDGNYRNHHHHIQMGEPRRNPTRKARNSKFGRRSNDDNIYEEDFCMLDSTDDESSPDEIFQVSRSSAVTRTPEQDKPQNLSLKDLKPWPVNGLHERPEFNVITQKIEKFDYTIREIQNNAIMASSSGTLKKTPKINEIVKTTTASKAQPKKPASKKYVTKKKTPKKTNSKFFGKVSDKVAFDSLRSLIQDNASILTNFIFKMQNERDDNFHGCHDVFLNGGNKENQPQTSHSNCENNYKRLLKNQTCLISLLNQMTVEDNSGFLNTFE